MVHDFATGHALPLDHTLRTSLYEAYIAMLPRVHSPLLCYFILSRNKYALMRKIRGDGQML